MGAPPMRAPGPAVTVGVMVQARWTYELLVFGSLAESRDDHEARATGGAHVEIVTGLVGRAGGRCRRVHAGRLPRLLRGRLRCLSVPRAARVRHRPRSALAILVGFAAAG
jgi:hypothetical protein